MCPDCLERERQLKLQSEAFANLRIEISNELTGLEPPKELAGEKSMAVNEKFVDEHVAFWNEENKLIQDMNMQELDARMEEWEKIYREAKTKLSADRELKRNRIANLSKEERDKLLNPNANPQDSRLVTDSIQAVKKRQERMTLAEKTAESMRALYSMAGMTSEQIDSAIKASFADLRVSTDKPASALTDERPIPQTSFIKDPLTARKVPASTLDSDDTQSITTPKKPVQPSMPYQTEAVSIPAEPIDPMDAVSKAKNWFDSSTLKFGK